MLLQDLLNFKDVEKGVENLDKNICDIKIDSTKVKPGDVFFAMQGWKRNGDDYALEALNNGAEVVVSQQNLPFENVVVVKNVRASHAKA